VNLNIREKLGIPTGEQRPTVDTLFEGGHTRVQ
jgi:general secretion pathway protein D